MLCIVIYLYVDIPLPMVVYLTQVILSSPAITRPTIKMKELY